MALDYDNCTPKPRLNYLLESLELNIIDSVIFNILWCSAKINKLLNPLADIFVKTAVVYYRNKIAGLF